MEVLEMEKTQETKKTEDQLISAAAFVQGGVQEACDDACSICLEEFCESDPSTVTSCRHEFHLQCILEWCQRSSQCPMCWQSIHLKDPTSQELLEGVVRERKIRLAPPRHATIFHHPTLGDFELQHLPVGASDADLEERIIQHLAAAAAMGRTHHHLGRRDGHRGRPSGHNRPHLLVLSPHPNARPGHGPSALLGDEHEEHVGYGSSAMPNISYREDGSSRQITIQPSHIYSSTSGATAVAPMSRQGIAVTNRSFSGRTSSPTQERGGPSDFQSFSDSLKSKWNAVSMRYKESISRSTRGWREKFFARNTSDLSPENRREENEGISSITRGMDRLQAQENAGANSALGSSDDPAMGSVVGTTYERNNENQDDIRVTDRSAPHAAAGSLSN